MVGALLRRVRWIVYFGEVILEDIVSFITTMNWRFLDSWTVIVRKSKDLTKDY
jgi:hypothetical protein